VEETRNGRDINRHNYHLDEIHEEVARPVVQRLIRLMEFRNTYPAFDGELTVEDTPESRVKLTYTSGKYTCTARIDLFDYSTQIKYYDEKANTMKTFSA
jgi:sucrose phosphorylase